MEERTEGHIQTLGIDHSSLKLRARKFAGSSSDNALDLCLEVPVSELGRDTYYPNRFSAVSLSLSREMPG
jgi:hypothetical protein